MRGLGPLTGLCRGWVGVGGAQGLAPSKLGVDPGASQTGAAGALRTAGRGAGAAAAEHRLKRERPG